MSVNFQQLEQIISQNDGHLYNYGRDGFIVTNSSGKEMLHLPSGGDGAINPQNIERVKQFFSDINSQSIDQQETVENPIIWIDTEVSVLDDSEQRVTCSRALGKMAEHYSPVVRIHFDKDPVFWQDLLSPFIESLQGEIKDNAVNLQLHGTFERMEDSVMEFLFNNRIQLYYISGTSSFSQDGGNICNLAEYGFRVPCVWYVDQENISLIPSLIEEAMRWNYDAGFSLPLATERIVGHVKNNPSNADYLRLILDIYKEYQCYDDVFYPMNMTLLESIGVTSNSRLRTWRWNDENTSFYEHVCDANIDKIHNILRHSFIWQRHIVKNKLESLLSNNCPSTTNEGIETESSDNVVQ